MQIGVNRFMFFISCACILIGCQNSPSTASYRSDKQAGSALSDTSDRSSGNTIEARFPPPDGFERLTSNPNSFTHYLRNLPLKKQRGDVLLYNGKKKFNQRAHEAVIDLNIGTKDLHQCADAVMRLRAEYLWDQKRFTDIHFNFTNGFKVDYTEWMQGRRIQVRGNKTKWVDALSPSNSYSDFWKYMETIFMYAGTMSLSKELRAVQVEDMKIGDVFIQGGFPGHAIIIVDMAIDKKSKKKVFLLAQSYMPAQEIHVLKNTADRIGPWYRTNFGSTLNTPEWTFSNDDLMRFEE